MKAFASVCRVGSCGQCLQCGIKNPIWRCKRIGQPKYCFRSLAISCFDESTQVCTMPEEGSAAAPDAVEVVEENGLRKVRPSAPPARRHRRTAASGKKDGHLLVRAPCRRHAAGHQRVHLAGHRVRRAPQLRLHLLRGSIGPNAWAEVHLRTGSIACTPMRGVCAHRLLLQGPSESCKCCL